MVEEHKNEFHEAINALLAASFHASPEEVAPIFAACKALATKYQPAIAARRRELASAFVQRRLAERQGRS